MTALALAASLRIQAERAPDRAAITDDVEALSRLEVDWLSDLAAHRLAEQGVEHGSIVAITGKNSARLLMAMFAIWKLGAVPLPMHSRKPNDELTDLIARAEPALAVGFDSAVTAGIGSGLDTIELDALFEPGEFAPPSSVAVSPRLRIGTSGGSSGASKLISVDVPAIVNPDRPWHYGLRADGTHVVPLDITDGTGFVATTAALALGCHVVMMTSFDAESMLRLVEHHRCDWIALTQPSMLSVAKLPAAQRESYDMSSIRCVTQYSGGVADWVKDVWIDWLGPQRVAESYGATDARGSTWITGTEWLTHRGSVGRAHRGCELAILDEDGDAVPTGAIGHVYLRDRTGNRNFHYLGHRSTPLQGGWESVGDMGWLDDDGYLYIADRASDMIDTPTGLVAPLPIEGAIEFHARVRSALVVGLPNSAHGERVHAVVDAPDGVDMHELEEMLATRFGHLRLPDSWSTWSGPLRDNAGKAQRRRVREHLLRGDIRPLTNRSR